MTNGQILISLKSHIKFILESMISKIVIYLKCDVQKA